MPRTKLRGLTVAGLRLAIEAPPNLPWDWPEGPLRRFASSAEGADVCVGVRVARPEPPGALKFDSSAGSFEIARDGSDWIVALRRRGALQRLARFDRDFRIGEVIVDPDSFCARSGHYPLSNPLDELIFLHRLAREGGLLLRASAVVRDGRARLFSGPSGAGKTTISRWMLEAGPCSVLSDDRVVIRLEPDGGFRVHGTPWHGDAPLASPAAARLDGIHAIHHAPVLRDRPLAAAEAAATVLGNAFIPAHDAVGAARVFELAERLVARVGVSRLGFPKDRAVVSYAWGESAGAMACP
jgi:hypothetical protein